MFIYKSYRQQFLESDQVVNDASLYSIEIEAAHVPEGAWYWKIIGIHHLMPKENDGKNNLFMEALDENGQRVKQKAAWTWEGRRPDEAAPPISLDQPETGPAGTLAVWINQTISAWIEHEYSDAITNVHTRHPNEPIGNTTGHHSFYVVWQWTKKETKKEAPAVAPPLQAADNAEELLLQMKKLLDTYFENKRR